MNKLYILIFNLFSIWMVAKSSNCLTAPPNDLCSDAVELIPNITPSYTFGTFNGALKDGGDVGCAADAVQDVWYRFTATDATMGISMGYTSGANQAFQILQGGCNGSVIACINTYGIDQPENYMDVVFVPGQEYYIRVLNAGGFYSNATFNICVIKYPAPINDLCANAITLAPNASCSYTAGGFSGSLKDGGAVGCATDAVQDVWYTFTATGTVMNISMGATSGANQAFQVLQGGCNGTVVACVDTFGIGQAENFVDSTFIPGQEYYIRVLNSGGFYSTSTFYICVYGEEQPCTASVALSASDTQVCAGSEITFTATPVNGGTTPQYQWKRNGLDVGTNSPIYSAADFIDNDNVSVVMVSNATCASMDPVASNTIQLAVSAPITPVFDPIPAICPGASLMLPTVSNNGITGNWAPAVNNNTTTTYTFTPSGQCATTTTLSVTVNQVDTTVTQQDHVLNAVATNATYQWINCLGNQPINGATDSSFTAVENGSYAVIVTQNGCSETSDCVAVNNLGVASLEVSGFSAYPNPVSDLLFVDSKIGMEIAIFDVTGKAILHQYIEPGRNKIDVSAIMPGLYMVQSHTGLPLKLIRK